MNAPQLQLNVSEVRVDAEGNPYCVVLFRPEQLGLKATRVGDGCTVCPHVAHVDGPCTAEVSELPPVTALEPGLDRIVTEVKRPCGCAVLDKTAPRFNLERIEQPRIISPHQGPHAPLSLARH